MQAFHGRIYSRHLRSFHVQGSSQIKAGRCPDPNGFPQPFLPHHTGIPTVYDVSANKDKSSDSTSTTSPSPSTTQVSSLLQPLSTMSWVAKRTWYGGKTLVFYPWIVPQYESEAVTKFGLLLEALTNADKMWVVDVLDVLKKRILVDAKEEKRLIKAMGDLEKLKVSVRMTEKDCRD